MTPRHPPLAGPSVAASLRDLESETAATGTDPEVPLGKRDLLTPAAARATLLPMIVASAEEPD